MSDPAQERYSFSKLNAFHTCPYGWWERYVNHKPGIGNAFSSFGTLVHSLMECYAKGEAEIWDLPELYEWEFPSAVPEEFPPNKYTVLRDTYYKQGLDFLKRFQGYNQYKILGVEKVFELPVNDWTFTGIIDIIFADEKGRLIIRDYKSKAGFKNAKEQKEYARQLYLYSLEAKREFGRYPDELQFLMFRKQMLVKIPFDKDALDEAVGWADSTVHAIRDAISYPPTCDAFFGNYLCNHREYCPFRIEPGGRREK